MKPFRITTVVASLLLALLVVAPVSMAKDKTEDLYPNATRQAPDIDLKSQDTADALNKGLSAVNAGDAETAKEVLEPIAKKSKSKYAQAMALQGMASLVFDQGDIDAAIAKLKKALDIGIMPNDPYFQMMYMLVQFEYAGEHYQEALDTLHKWREQGQRQTARSYGLEGQIDYQLGQYEDAIAALTKAKKMSEAEGKTSHPSNWDQVLAAAYAETGNTDKALADAKAILAKDPTDTATLHNAVSLLIRDDKYDDAVKLMEKSYAAGAITTGDEYTRMAKLYMLIAQQAEDSKPSSDKATKMLETGLEKGALEPSYDVYKLEAQAAMLRDDYKAAMAAYDKAAPYAEGGDLDLRRGELMARFDKNAQAAKLLKQALAKGIDKEGHAYLLLGAVNANMQNRSAALKAMKKAAQYSATKQQAEHWLQQAGAQ